MRMAHGCDAAADDSRLIEAEMERKPVKKPAPLSHAGVPSIGSYSHPTVIQDQVILACREDVRNNIQKSLRFPVNDPGGVRERKEAQIRHPFCTRAKRQSGRVTVEVLLSCSAFYDTKTLIHSRSSRSSSAHRDRHSKDSLRPDADEKPILYEDYPGVNEDSDPIVISDDDDAELTTYVFFSFCLSTHNVC
jgi:hypothetical protein